MLPIRSVRARTEPPSHAAACTGACDACTPQRSRHRRSASCQRHHRPHLLCGAQRRVPRQSGRRDRAPARTARRRAPAPGHCTSANAPSARPCGRQSAPGARTWALHLRERAERAPVRQAERAGRGRAVLERERSPRAVVQPERREQRHARQRLPRAAGRARVAVLQAQQQRRRRRAPCRARARAVSSVSQPAGQHSPTSMPVSRVAARVPAMTQQARRAQAPRHAPALPSAHACLPRPPSLHDP